MSPLSGICSSAAFLALGAFLKVAASRRGWAYLFACEQIFDGEDLDARVFVLQAGRFVESGFGRLFQHGFGGWFHADWDTALRVFAFDDAAQVAYIRRVEFPGLHRQNNLLGLAALLVVEK